MTKNLKMPYLRDKVLLELDQELQVQQIVGGQRLLTDDGLHGLHVLADGVTSVLQSHTQTKKHFPSAQSHNTHIDSEQLFDTLTS